MSAENSAPRGSTRGRKPGQGNKPIDLEKLEWLTIPLALKLLKMLGRPTGRKALERAILAGYLPAYTDTCRIDRLGQPLLRIKREDLDIWLTNALKRIYPGMGR